MSATTNKGANKTALDAMNPTAMLEGAKLGGKLRWRWDYFKSAAQIDSGSTIELPGFKKGEAPIGIVVVTPGVGAATTCQVGDGSDADRFIGTGGITTLSAAGQQFKPFLAGVMGVPLTADARVVVTTEAANFAADKTIYFGLVYASSN